MKDKLRRGGGPLLAGAALLVALWAALDGRGPVPGVATAPEWTTVFTSVRATNGAWIENGLWASGGPVALFGSDVQMGDLGLAANGTQIKLDDAEQTIELGNPDTGNVLRVDSGAGNILASEMSLNTRRPIAAKTASYSLTRADTRGITSNIAATGMVTLTLPGADAGLDYCFYVGTAQTLAIDPATGDQIAALTNATGDKITNGTAGSSICLAAADGTNWLPLGAVGTWADGN